MTGIWCTASWSIWQETEGQENDGRRSTRLAHREKVGREEGRVFIAMLTRRKTM